MAKGFEFINRDISWLSFNDRVLQEAADKRNPLVERIRFLGIFSNNRDEFFRVRVATIKRMITFKQKEQDPQYKKPELILKKVHDISVVQQKKFYQIYAELESELEINQINLIDETEVGEEHQNFIQNYFESNVYPALVPVMLNNVKEIPYLRDKEIYLAVELSESESNQDRQYAIIEIPSHLDRFIVLPKKSSKKQIMLLDDVIRFNLSTVFSIFDYNKIEAYTIKVTRDAEMDLDNDVSKSFLEKMSKSLKQRKLGEPVRLVYDNELPQNFIQFLMNQLGMDNDDSLIPGGRYHNFKDFIKFPNVGERSLEFRKIKSLAVKQFKDKKSILSVIAKEDVLVHYPYQSFNYLIDLLREAAIDPNVRKIKMTAYRLASESKVVNTLINAARNGKKVTVVIELQARFDEANNIHWTNVLQENGVKVLNGMSGLKIHSKLMLITRKEGKEKVKYASIGTGNFHEGTAKIYSDLSLFTAHHEIADEVSKVFNMIEGKIAPYYYKHLLLSPNRLRNKMVRLINTEIKNAKSGKEASIYLKLNSLVDNDLIIKLYQASKAGVKIKLNIRGICSLVAGVKGMSENIEAISILDKFLEHSRVYVFGNGGNPIYYISSADWMVRNLDRRIEVACPIYDENLKTEIQYFLDLQFNDNVKARNLDRNQSNNYRINDLKEIRAQFELYNYYKKKLN